MVQDAKAPPSPGAKRFRPSDISIDRNRIPIRLDSASLKVPSSDEVFEETLQLSDSDDSRPASPTVTPLKAVTPTNDNLPDDLSKDLAALHELRKSVKKNLRLRPIRSRGTLPKVNLGSDLTTSPTSRSPRNDTHPLSAMSPTSSISSYFTPISEMPSTPSFSTSSTADFPSIPSPPLPSLSQTPCSIAPKALYNRLLSPKRPLVIDTRAAASYQSFHLRHSINIAIPSLILKRCRRPGGGLQSLDALRQFITSERGKAEWDDLMRSGGPWDGDVVICDDDMDLKEKDNVGVIAWAIIPILSPLLSYGSVDYLEGGLARAGHHSDLETLIVTGDEEPSGLPVLSGAPPSRKGSGLFQLDTQTMFRSKKLPEIEPSSATSTQPPSPRSRSPLPIMPAISSVQPLRSSDPNLLNVSDATPSPPPSSIGFRRPPPPNRRPSVPNLRRIDTKSTERLNPNLPKLSVRTKPLRSATLTIPPSLTIQPPRSPSHLQLIYSTHSPPNSAARFTPTSPSNDPSNYLTPYYTPPHTPGTPKPFSPPSPATARPDLDPPTTEDAYHVFAVSTILPNFLFLGPELTLPEHVTELQELGVRRILNIAFECDDDQGLHLREVFEKYYKIPMRDTVEEENISKGVREVCEILDDARLHSAPTYVHCKAGKSRSVTAVMAYLIHANHWTLSRAYSFVLERRKGISPNIGFVSELMTFEEQELGGKSVGVQPTPAPSNGANSSAMNGTENGATGGSQIGGPQDSYGAAVCAAPMRRGGHARESLPPALGGLDSITGGGGPMSAGGLLERVMGDSGQEMEIKDSTGRYRHARRAPVDENTLQPMRRVSKAGLESSTYT